LEADGINGACFVMQDPKGNEFCLDRVGCGQTACAEGGGGCDLSHRRDR
jgi:hypothetical protein